MGEIWIAIISGSMALLGVALSSFISMKTSKKEKQWEHHNMIMTKKEALYIRVIKDLDIPSTENQFIGSAMFTDITGEESYDIEAQMQLYAPKDILQKYHQAVEATEADLPCQEKELRYDSLVLAMRKDLGIEV